MSRRSTLLAAFPFLAPAAFGCSPGLIDTCDSPHALHYMVGLEDVRWTEGFWAERFEVVRDSMIPYMWELFQDDFESHAWSNFLIAAGLGMGRHGEGKFRGPPFNDGDLLKWFEGVASVYAVTKDPALDALMDRVIEVVGKAQREDGYLHTKVIIPQRQGLDTAREFLDRNHFETYNMGHLITAAVIHKRATGKDSMLKLALKAADYIEKLALEKPAELAVNAICPSHYMGVIELYRETGDTRYRDLGKTLIDIRTLVPPEVGSDDNQDRTPFREQTEAVGHAVRANYLFAGVADVVAEVDDPTLLAPLHLLADNVASKKLYITGMTGAVYDGASPYGSYHHNTVTRTHQAYGYNYQLPNITAYNETCATIGYNLWNWRMFTVTGESRYTDLFERTLYNGILPGISLAGTEYFYVNVLRKVEDFPVDLRWYRTRQPNLKRSFCCPPNVVRTLAQVQNYVYSLSDDTLWVHLYGGNRLSTQWKNGERIALRQETNYPWQGAVKLTIEEAPETAVALKLRVPAWSDAATTSLRVNGREVPVTVPPGEYATVEQRFAAGDVVEFDIGFTIALYEAHPYVEETRNQVALQYGPLVYCVESNDLPEGIRIDHVAVPANALERGWKAAEKRIDNTTVTAITLEAHAYTPAEEWDQDTLFRPKRPLEPRKFDLTFVPYYAWGNRGDTEMTVWLPLR
jgi:uncharacterized protein